MTLATAPARSRTPMMAASWLDGLVLFVVALAINLLASRFISQPGYTDAYYYFGGARQLASGQGFSEPYLWNYLAPVPAVVAGQPLWPSHLYWMPLVSLVAAPFMAGARQVAGTALSNAALFRAAQWPFVLLASALPVLAYLVAEQLGGSRRHAVAAGLLTLFSPYYFVFWTTTDAFALYALLAAGALVLTTLALNRPANALGWLFAAGLAAGLAHLTRADGILLILCLMAWLAAQPAGQPGWRARLVPVAVVLAGYGLVMAPWFWRNWAVAGAPLGLGGTRTIWLTRYDDLFTFTPERLSVANYVAAGAGTILSDKWSAFLANAQTIIAVQCSIVAFPFVLIGLWRLRHQALIQLALLYGLALLAAMTLVFTFPGARGGFFHSGAALLPFFMPCALVGVDSAVEWVARRLRHWQPERSKPIFGGLLVGGAMLLTVAVFWTRVIGPNARQPVWQTSEDVYGEVSAWLAADGQHGVLAAVNDPPGWNYWSGWPGIVIPNGDAATLRQAMTTYGARFVVLDTNRPAALAGLYVNPHSLSVFRLRASFSANDGQPVYLLELVPEQIGLQLRRLAARPELLFALAATASVLVYLGASRVGGSMGFPLDDAWIHQTYARNLGLRGEFSFVPGQPSAGSTSPLWSGLLALGYLARLNPLVWTYALGVGLLALNAWLVYRLVLRWWPGATAAAVAGGVLVTLEWHLVWSAGSGMETLLFSACVLAVFVFDWPAQAGWAGLVAGLAVLTRPDGLSLGAVLVARVFLSNQRSWRAAIRAGLGFGALLAPYLLFNFALSGSPWPNTFYAKQAEYAVLRDQPLLTRLATVGVLPFVGVLALLLPAIVVLVWWAGSRLWADSRRRWEALIALGWALALMGAYALRLPVTYQHGRYLMPVIPILLALGMGSLAAIVRPRSSQMLARVFSRAWLAALALLALVFWLRGALAYRTDVQIIQTEMVATGQWVAANTPAGSLIAAHDIGALGYFGGRPILDMAGLISPQVIPFIRDEGQLSGWLDREGANYLVTFPNWYPSLSASSQAERVFTTSAPFSPAQGGENMAVYSWRAKP